MCVSVSKGKPRSLQHLCRLVIRSHMSLRTLNDPETMAAGPFPPRLMNYLTYRERDLYVDLLSVWNTFYLNMWLKCENSQSAHLMQYLISVVFLQTELKTKKWMSSIWNRCPSHKCFKFMHEESWASVTWSWTFAGWRVLTLGCTSDWTQHSSISGSKMACVNYAAFVIVIKNNHLCYILYYILVQTRMIWCLKYFFHILKIGNEKKKKYKPATEQCQHPFCLCVSMRDTSSLFIFFVLLSVWSFDLFLAVIPSHRYIDFVAPTADFMIFVTWIWNLVVFNWLFFLGPSCDFCHCDSGLPLGATFQPASHMWCSKLLWELGEDDPSCSCDTRYQCEAAPQHHGPPLCFTLAGVGANKP